MLTRRNAGMRISYVNIQRKSSGISAENTKDMDKLLLAE